MEEAILQAHWWVKLEADSLAESKADLEESMKKCSGKILKNSRKLTELEEELAERGLLDEAMERHLARQGKNQEDRNVEGP